MEEGIEADSIYSRVCTMSFANLLQTQKLTHVFILVSVLTQDCCKWCWWFRRGRFLLAATSSRCPVSLQSFLKMQTTKARNKTYAIEPSLTSYCSEGMKTYSHFLQMCE